MGSIDGYVFTTYSITIESMSKIILAFVIKPIVLHTFL